jgi:hypothetical protein
MRDSGKVWRFCDSGRLGPADLHTDPFLAFPGRKTPASGKEKGEADVEQRERADRDAGAADDLKRHAPAREANFFLRCARAACSVKRRPRLPMQESLRMDGSQNPVRKMNVKRFKI